MNSDSKKIFIDDEIWILTFGGGFQRANIYKKGVSGVKKNELRNYIKQYVRKLVESLYMSKKCPDDKRHAENISKFCRNISRNFKEILNQGKFKIGIGQKILNLYLKYLWCLGLIPEPPHCPFDRIVISKLGMNVSWTKLDNIDQYNELVNIARIKAKRKSLAEWEFEIFSRR